MLAASRRTINPPIPMTKQEMRREIRKAKADFAAMMPAWSAAICRSIAASPEWKAASTVLLYHALPDEPQLQALLDKALTAGKQVLLPVVVGDDLVIRHYEGSKYLAEGAYSIMEPTGEDLPREAYGDIDLAIVPGMAFDREGHRLGRGRGYYDRLLPRLTHASFIGVCFPFQLLEAIPHEPHDVRMNRILTPLQD